MKTETRPKARSKTKKIIKSEPLFLPEVLIGLSLVVSTIALLGASGYFFSRSRGPVQVKMVPSAEKKIKAFEQEFSISADTSNWKSYFEKKYNFEIKYPDNLIVVSNKENMTALAQSLLPKESNPCEIGKGESSDFMYLKIFNSDAATTVRLFEGDLALRNISGGGIKTEKGRVEEVRIGDMQGYSFISYGPKNCRKNTYYFPLNADKTLVVPRTLVYIGPNSDSRVEDLNKLFKMILETFQWTEKEN